MSLSHKIVYDRNKLYTEVWAEPVTIVSKRYGISNVALAKVCRRLGVPLPPRGHWVRIKAGQTVHQPALPVFDGPSIIESQRCVPEDPFREERCRVLEEMLGASVFPAAFFVSDTLDNPHPLVKQTEDVLLATRTSVYGVLFRCDRTLDAKVSPSLLDRAMRIFDALIKGVERLGYRVTIDEGVKNDTIVEAFGFPVQIGLEEVVRSTRNIANPEHTGRRGWGQYGTEGLWDFRPTGSLRLVIKDGLRPETLWRYWGDSNRIRLEDRLVHFLRAVLETAAHKVVLERERQHRERERKAGI